MLKYDHELNLTEENSPSIILRQITPNSRVLEFGPATGYMTRYLKEILNCYISCIEVDPNSAEISAQFCDDMIVADLDEMLWLDKLHDQRYDFLIFADVLEHLKNPWKVLNAASKLLSDTGRIIISVPNVGHNAIVMSLMHGEFEYKKLGLLDETHLRFFTRKSLLQLIDSADLAPVILNATISTPELTEFKQSYIDYPKQVRDYLLSSRDGHVYQFIFTCKKKDNITSEDNCIDLIAETEISTSPVFFQVYWQENGQFNERSSAIVQFNTENEMEYFQIELPKGYSGDLRIDPTNIPAFIQIDSIRIYDSNLIELKTFQSQEINFSEDIIKISEKSSQIKLLATSKDPQIYVRIEDEAARLKVAIKYSEDSPHHLFEELQDQNYQLKITSDQLSEEKKRFAKIKSEIDELQTKFDFKVKKLNEIQAEHIILISKIENLKDENEKFHVNNFKIQKRLDSATVSLKQLETELHDKVTLIDNIYLSFSWKITKPFRTLGKVIRNPKAYTRSLTDLFIRKSYDLKLKVVAELEKTKESEWKSTGTDPQFHLVGRYPVGWSKLTLDITPIGSTQGKMRLYLDKGRSFNEADSYGMGNIGAKNKHYIHFDANLFNLRFDPIESEGEFTLSGVRLTRVSRLEIILDNTFNHFKTKIRKWFGFSKYAITKARDWRTQRGRYPNLNEIPDLARKAIHKWRTNQHHILNDQILPPSGFVLSQTLESYQAWLEVNEWNNRRESLLNSKLNQMAHMPKLSIVMPVYNPPIEYLDQAIESVLQQRYSNWELLIADDASPDPNIRPALEKWAEKDDRIKVRYLESNGNISVSSNAAAELATGDYIILMDNDDELTPDALAEVALYVAANPKTDVLYSDDDKIDTRGSRFAPQFKPDWSPELLLSYMYFSHILVIRTSLFKQVGGFRRGFEGSQDYDLALRVTEKARHVGHIPMVLYHWRVLPNSTASSGAAKPESFEAGRKAVQEALERRGINAKVYQPEWALKAACGIYSHEFYDYGPSVAIIIPTKNQYKILKACIDSIRKTTYQNYQVYIIDNDSDDQETLEYLASMPHTVLKISNPNGKFSYAYINNQAVKSVKEDYVLFLNNDTEVINPRWLSQMVGYLSIKGVGAVGARLLFPDGRLQHAGITHGYYNGMAGPSFKLMPEWNNGYLSYAKVLRNSLAVTAACMLTPRQLFLEQGSFDEQRFAVAYNDVDYCYRLHMSGYRVVYCPDAELRHYEGYSRGFADNPAEGAAFREAYGEWVDPYYNPNLLLDNEQFDIASKVVIVNENVRPIRTLMCAFNLNWEGAPYSQYEMTVHLKNSGIIDPIVYSPYDGPLRKAYEDQGITVEVFNHPLTGVSNLYAYDNAINQFKQKIQGWNVELVYGNTLQTFYAIDAAKLSDLPSIWNPRESEPWQTYFNHFGDDIAARALNCFNYPYKIIFVANATRNGCLPLNAHHNFTTIHNGLDRERLYKQMDKWPRTKAREHLNVDSDELMVLLLGTVCDRKGQMDLVKAVALLEQDQVKAIKCFIVGDRPSDYSKQMHMFIEGLSEDFRKKIIVVPETSETALYYSAADIFVCSSRIESFPRVILEAMASGLPIITTPAFGITEQVQQDVNGVFYQPGDVQDLARHIGRFIELPDFRLKLAHNSKHVLNLLNDYDSMAKSYGQIFREAWLSGRSR
ncbi:glycosyltransferase [Bacillus sp. 3255]|uniref:glycosyltransferase n=1 Tax=Bacillus sp. 3255 TaxID=2817904 RepID=UPI00285DBA39|nr:glycosyltransferase [Bacillus sp. 3255]MDR6878743.1 GT2 family glycosyltransferase/glycosyltransferase involved in cell wall biosynthesis/2-polyprenyl-3-methyl-5-hydroxy-6-metoxy-1,4-benzoquinol methylase [Bacillus sp. 3255]